MAVRSRGLSVLPLDGMVQTVKHSIEKPAYSDQEDLIMENELIAQLTQLRALYTEAVPTDPTLINDYAWLIVKALNHETDQLGSVMCRQLLADYLRLPVARPSRLHSALLSAALRVHAAYPDFHFAAFLRMWDTRHLQAEDLLPYSKDGKVYRSLAERTARSYVRSLLFFPAERLPEEQLEMLRSAIENGGLLAPQKMVVTKITVSDVRGRKMRFVQLVSPEGIEVSCESHALHASPLSAPVASADGASPVPQRHYVNVGQLYDVLLSKTKSAPVPGVRYRPYNVTEGYLSTTPIEEVFPLVTGYVAGTDRQRNSVHVYDVFSRHFVAANDRFSRTKNGDFVRFIPVIPADNAFKSAIIVGGGSADQLAPTFPPKQIRVVSINQQKGYLSWELLDASDAIVESLSPFQQQHGEVSPSFIRGFISFRQPSAESGEALSIPYEVGDVLNAIIFLRRGQDGQKRPFVAKVLSRTCPDDI